MNETSARRPTGLAGIATAAAFIVEVPLYFIYLGRRRTRTSWPGC